MNLFRSAGLSIFFFCCIAFTSHAVAQTLYFCDDISDDGYPMRSGSTFTISKDGGFLKFLVRMPGAVQSTSVSYDLYRVDRGEETYRTTIKQDVSSTAAWFSKEVTFYEEGYFRVYVYDDEDKLLAKGDLQIKFSGK